MLVSVGMTEKIHNAVHSPQEAAEFLIKTVRIPPLYKEKLIELFNSPDVYRRLTDFLAGPAPSFHNMPADIREILEKYSQQLIDCAETDVCRRVDSNGGDAFENFRRDFSTENLEPVERKEDGVATRDMTTDSFLVPLDRPKAAFYKDVVGPLYANIGRRDRNPDANQKK